MSPSPSCSLAAATCCCSYINVHKRDFECAVEMWAREKTYVLIGLILQGVPAGQAFVDVLTNHGTGGHLLYGHARIPTARTPRARQHDSSRGQCLDTPGKQHRRQRAFSATKSTRIEVADADSSRGVSDASDLLAGNYKLSPEPPVPLRVEEMTSWSLASASSGLSESPSEDDARPAPEVDDRTHDLKELWDSVTEKLVDLSLLSKRADGSVVMDGDSLLNLVSPRLP